MATAEFWPLWPPKDDALDNELLLAPWGQLVQRWEWTVECILAPLEFWMPPRYCRLVHVRTIILAASRHADGSFERTLNAEVRRTWERIIPEYTSILVDKQALPVRARVLRDLAERCSPLDAFLFAAYAYDDARPTDVPPYVMGRLNDEEMGRLLDKSKEAIRTAAHRARERAETLVREMTGL